VRSATVTAGSTTYKIDIWVERSDANCAEHAYGKPVVAYLTAHPCRGLTRQLATTTVKGKKVGFNVSILSIPGTATQPYANAANFRALVLQDGTGSINDLMREGRRLPSGPTSIPDAEVFTTLAQDSGLNIYDVWYLDGPTSPNDPALIKMTQDIYLQY
jgi:hypothetical protein